MKVTMGDQIRNPAGGADLGDLAPGAPAHAGQESVLKWEQVPFDAAATRWPHGVLMLAGLQIPPNGMSGDVLCWYPEELSLTVLISDVRGKGPQAAVVAAKLHHTFCQLAPRTHAASILPHLNQTVIALQHDLQDSELFATAVLLAIDLRTRVLSVRNAGHHPLLLIRKGRVRPLAVSGPMLGLGTAAEFPGIRRPLRLGDQLVGSTDGMTDVLAPDGQCLGESGWRSLVRRYRHRRPEDLVKALFGAVGAFGRVRDDRTAVVIEYRLPPCEPARRK